LRTSSTTVWIAAWSVTSGSKLTKTFW